MGNRVALIQELVPTAQWRHGPGSDNPADCASRGLLTSQLIEHPLWWHGPTWLTKDIEHWPSQSASLDETDVSEVRPRVTLKAAKSPLNYHWDLILKYSSLPRLLRITGWCIIACRRFKEKGRLATPASITLAILNEALLYWIRETQRVHLSHEIKQLKSSSLSKHHVLARLTAFVDIQGILRVGGRLGNATMEFSSKHPAIIPRRTPLTTLVIRYSHSQTLHGGAQLTLAHTRQNHWIIGGRAPIKSHILQCVACARQRSQRAHQLMGQLPLERVSPSSPFTHTGIDYAGPIFLKSWKGRGSKVYKSWICIFVCFSTSSVHLEQVSDYTTEGFIAAYQRFTSRRGVPSTLYSDCGTNFIGADKELKGWFRQAQQRESSEFRFLTNQGTVWKFNPPASPHMGGKWEAVVKSIKFHLCRTIGEASLTFEESLTLLSRIEAILNSRPLEPLSEDPTDASALTPGHFLTGKPLMAIPQPDLLDLSESRLSRWQYINQRTQQFWKAWSMHYLQRLHSISKWHHPSNIIKVGSLVLLTDERLPPTKWPLARVIKLHPGKDNLTRVVTLKTPTTELVRPIAKLAILFLHYYYLAILFLRSQFGNKQSLPLLIQR